MSDDEGFALCTSSHVGDTVWILDSACSYHMCPSREMFCSYKSQVGNVLMGNDHPCQIIGIGTIKIWMFDGIVRTLTNVRHIPDLKRNLISLGALDTHGCKWATVDGTLTVSRGSLVVMKGNKQDNLYVLEGSTIVDSANAPSSGGGLTPLWHARLGHMSQKGLAILCKQNLLPGANKCQLGFCDHCTLGKQRRVSFGV
ncbi:unnamed protein product [Calypogeia fissa]